LSKLVYIGGYGHSGSTLLEYLLTASAKVVACGEVLAALHARLRKQKCTCGKAVSDCEVWGRFSREHLQLDRWTHQDLTLELLSEVSGNHTMLVDSSKTAWRSATTPLRFRRMLGRQFHLIHIVRDPRAVCWSILRRAQSTGNLPSSELLRCAFTILGWWTANLTCELFGLLYRDQYVRVRYEDLTRSTIPCMNRLFQALLTEGDIRFDTLGATSNRHQLYGNRMRRRRLSLSGIKEDREWSRVMPPASLRLVEALSWPLRRKYGYSVGDSE